MIKFRKRTGKHHIKQQDGTLKTYLPGEIIECEPEFLGNALDTFDKIEEESKPIPINVPKVVQEVEINNPLVETKVSSGKKKSKFSKG